MRVEDGVTLIPLLPPHGQTVATPAELLGMLARLKNKFELVIIDGPSGSSSALDACASAVDSAIVVRDVTRTDSLSLARFSHRVGRSGVRGMGVVENFT